MSEYHVRWMIRSDMPEVLEAEQLCFEFPWSEEKFITCLRARNVIGMVAEHRPSESLAGFMLYELHKHRMQLLNFAVMPRWQRKGVGVTMLDKLKQKLSNQRRSQITLEVRETNLDAQLFFASQGFRAVSVLRDFYEDTTEDAYLMRYRHREDDCELPVGAIAGIAR